MERGKAVGPDRIAIEVLEDSDTLLPLITKIYNDIFDSGEIAEDWQEAHVKPLYKRKGSPEEAKNYRFITLTSRLYKAFTSIISNRLMLQCMPQMFENQHGFMPADNT